MDVVIFLFSFSSTNFSHRSLHKQSVFDIPQSFETVSIILKWKVELIFFLKSIGLSCEFCINGIYYF